MKLKQITIIENDYQVVDWYVIPQQGIDHTYSNIRRFPEMNELQDYQESGVYHMAEVPFTVQKIDPYRYPDQEPYLAFGKDYSQIVYETLQKKIPFLCTGSYCTHVPSILGGIRRAVGNKKIGVVWMDAHTDNHIVETTKAEKLRLLGVPLSTLLGQTYQNWAKEVGLEPFIRGEDSIAGDVRYLDEESKENAQLAHITIIGKEDFNHPEIWKKAVNDLAQRVDVLFLHIDADILHHDYLPAYEYDVLNGNSIEIVKQNIASVAMTGKLIGATVMCIGFENKSDRDRDVNNMNGIRLVSSVLRNWKEIPEF